MGQCGQGDFTAHSFQGEHYEPVPFGQSSASGIFKPPDVYGSIHRLEAQFWHHAIITWVLMPVFVVLQLYIPLLEPSCEEGFRNCTIIVMLVFELHHMYAESVAWASAKEMLAPPEISVLRQLGFLGRRKRIVLLGMLEVAGLYINLTFPFVARACDDVLTLRWERAWTKVPLMGGFIVWTLGYLRFWGWAFLAALLNVIITGYVGLIHVFQHVELRKKAHGKRGDGGEDKRISGEVFFAWARSAETAMMPSVAMLCEEIAQQRRWMYDPARDASKSTKAREDMTLGKISQRMMEELQVQDLEEEERVEAAGKFHYSLLLIVKVFIGNVLSLWLQASFMALTFSTSGHQVRAKVIASMVISSVQAFVRCSVVTMRLGLIGGGLSFLIMTFVVWTWAKVFFAYTCPDHVWNLSTGCVDLSELSGL